MNQLYFNALVFTPEALRYLVAQVGGARWCWELDYRIRWEKHTVDHVFATTKRNDKQKAAILGGNAARLFGMKVAYRRSANMRFAAWSGRNLDLNYSSSRFSIVP